MPSRVSTAAEIAVRVASQPAVKPGAIEDREASNATTAALLVPGLAVVDGGSGQR